MNRIYNLKKRANKRIVKSSDGSITLYSSEFDECYHSIKDGALRESLKKHVEIAFELLEKRDKINILDVCFGLGYNTLSTIYHIWRNSIDVEVNIVSLEFDKELVESLRSFKYPKEFDSLKDIIEALSEYGYYKDDKIEIQIIFGDARESLPKLNYKFDIVYQDPFSPKKNPLLWTKEYFSIIRSLVSEDVILTTYSVATSIRVGLWEVGFFIYEHPEGEIRKGTIASIKRVKGLKEVDIKLKLKRNSKVKSLRDIDFI